MKRGCRSPGTGRLIESAFLRAAALLSLFGFLTGCAASPRGGRTQAGPRGESRPLTVAVLEFEDHSPAIGPAAAGMGRTLADRIVEELAGRPGIRPVDRDSLQKLLEELSLSSRALTNPENRLKLGRLLGVQYFVMGGLTAIGGEVRVDSRIVEVEKGVTEGVSSEGPLTERTAIEKGLSRQIADRLAAALVAGERPASTSRDFYLRGLVLENSKDDQQALKMYQRALALDPRNQEARERMEKLLLKEAQ